MIAPDIRVFPPEALSAATAGVIAEELSRAVAENGGARIALAGGGTPKPVYQTLAAPPYQQEVPWADVEVYFGDERCVAEDDPSSNFRMATESLLAHVGVASDRVHRIRGELEPEAAATAYASVIADAPLDIVLLGMGTDGHTASLFPGGSLGTSDMVLATTSPLAPTNRVSLGLAAVNAASVVIFLVAGESKATRVAEAHAQIASGRPLLPASHVQPTSGRLIWMLDTAAARLIEGSKS